MMPSRQINMAEAELRNHLRMLWEQHVFWTRLVISGIVFDLPDLKSTTNRLLRNPKDFEQALAPLYGPAIASRFASLFTEHLVVAAQLVQAAKAGNNTAAAEAEKKWYANADQIAAFLGSINPYWSAKDWQTMLYNHLEMTKTEAVNFLTKKYEDSVTVLDQIEQQVLQMADVMAYGIARQFPAQFS
ncbi:acetylglutamate kinase [Sporolactobacillus kofuensis]|uniref:Acetylglutamate kinase n=1 Tax=Sporolactobacillus kofuensis TaxID=269672 RepID=A0ABW1WIB8_9BACL|nr:acetylglutamate kinase [Sporolactobacillus kofuensis]MCO7176773.1 acetylglutamate kinase [Sporolactobacillus kofuensis]